MKMDKLHLKETGRLTKDQDLDYSKMQMDPFMRVPGLMIRRTVKES